MDSGNRYICGSRLLRSVHLARSHLRQPKEENGVSTLLTDNDRLLSGSRRIRRQDRPEDRLDLATSLTKPSGKDVSIIFESPEASRMSG